MSKVGERGDDLTSPEIQRMRIEEYAARTGITVVEWVEALDESASQRRSPWWARLDAAVDQVEAGTVDVILVWRLSRAARNRRRWAVAVDRVDVAGGSIESATEQIDARTSTGRLSRGILAELAAWESDVKGEIWRETFDRRRRVGLAHTNFPRFGYVRDDDAYTVDPQTAPLVAEAYRRYLAGDGGRQVAEWLNGLGVRQPRSGGAWSPKTVLRFLDSGWAAGMLLVDGRHVPAAHEPIIEAKVWQRFLRERARRRDVPARLVVPVTPLSGLVRCPGCGRSMRVKRLPPHREGRPRRPLYVCEAFGCPAPVSISLRRAVALTLAWLRPFADDVDVSAATRAVDSAAKATAKVERARLRRELARIDDAVGQLTVDLAEKIIYAVHYQAARDELLERRATVEAALAATEAVTDRPAPTPRRVRHLLDLWDGIDDIARNRGLRELVAYCEVIPAAPGRRAGLRPVGTWET